MDKDTFFSKAKGCECNQDIDRKYSESNCRKYKKFAVEFNDTIGIDTNREIKVDRVLMIFPPCTAYVVCKKSWYQK